MHQAAIEVLLEWTLQPVPGLSTILLLYTLCKDIKITNTAQQQGPQQCMAITPNSAQENSRIIKITFFSSGVVSSEVESCCGCGRPSGRLERLAWLGGRAEGGAPDRGPGEGVVVLLLMEYVMWASRAAPDQQWWRNRAGLGSRVLAAIDYKCTGICGEKLSFKDDYEGRHEIGTALIIFVPVQNMWMLLFRVYAGKCSRK